MLKNTINQLSNQSMEYALQILMEQLNALDKLLLVCSNYRIDVIEELENKYNTGAFYIVYELQNEVLLEENAVDEEEEFAYLLPEYKRGCTTREIAVEA